MSAALSVTSTETQAPIMDDTIIEEETPPLILATLTLTVTAPAALPQHEIITSIGTPFESEYQEHVAGPAVPSGGELESSTENLSEVHFPTGGAVLQTCFEGLLEDNARIAVDFTAR